MGKSRKPRKPKPLLPDQSPSGEEPEQLAPVPLPPRSPVPEHRSPAPSQPVLFDVIQTIRNVVETMLDIADAAAEAITKRFEGRA